MEDYWLEMLHSLLGRGLCRLWVLGILEGQRLHAVSRSYVEKITGRFLRLDPSGMCSLWLKVSQIGFWMSMEVSWSNF